MTQNPFDLFKSSQSKKNTKEKFEEKTSIPLHLSPSEPSESVPTNEDVARMFDQINQMKTDLLAKYDLFCEKTGLTREEVHSFFSNPNNFSPQKWEDVQKNRTLLEQQIISIFGQSSLKNAGYQQKKMNKERKSKTLGDRQKWIRM